jgi:uncharacterized protein (DUF2147 family)
MPIRSRAAKPPVQSLTRRLFAKFRRGASLIVMSMRQCLASIFLLLSGVLVGRAALADSPVDGNWLTADKGGIVQVYHCGDLLCGRLMWFRLDPNDPNPQALDLRNPDLSQRNRPLCGLTFIYGFKSTGPDNWEDGTIYDPDDGNTYHATITLRPDGTLDLHGYIGISLFGKSEIWTRYSQPLPACPGR